MYLMPYRDRYSLPGAKARLCPNKITWTIIGLLIALMIVTMLAWSGENRLGLWLLAAAVCLSLQNLYLMAVGYLLVHLTAAYVIPGAIWGFTESPPQFIAATSFWLAGSIVPYIILHKYFSHRSIYSLAIASYAVVHSFSPLAMFAPAPLIAAGHIFPGLGWVAFGLTALLLAAIIQILRKPSRSISVVLLLLIASSCISHFIASGKTLFPSDIRPVDTQYSQKSTYSKVDIFLRHKLLQHEVTQLHPRENNTLWVFPENVAIASPTETKSWWMFTNRQLLGKGNRVLYGTYFEHLHGQIKGAEIMPEASRVLSRLSVPFFEDSVSRLPWADSSFIHNGKRIEIVFCYEALFPLYTAISSSRADGLLLLAQLWMDVFDFGKGGSSAPLALHQRLALDGVTKAFNTPYQVSANFSP
jgi:hypothetical protein